MTVIKPRKYTLDQPLSLPDNFGEIIKGGDTVGGVLLLPGDPRTEPIDASLAPPNPSGGTVVLTPKDLAAIRSQVDEQKRRAAADPGPRQYIKKPEAPPFKLGTAGSIALGALVFGGIIFIAQSNRPEKRTKTKKPIDLDL